MATNKAKAKAPKDRPRPRRQPETLRLRQLTPSFTATDLQRSMAFYRDVLGFMLGQDDFKKGRDRQKGLGTRVWCHTAQDLDRLAAEIKARGGVLDQEPQDMPWGDRVFMISDPDGFKLTFVQAR